MFSSLEGIVTPLLRLLTLAEYLSTKSLYSIPNTLLTVVLYSIVSLNSFLRASAIGVAYAVSISVLNTLTNGTSEASVIGVLAKSTSFSPYLLFNFGLAAIASTAFINNSLVIAFFIEGNPAP